MGSNLVYTLAKKVYRKLFKPLICFFSDVQYLTCMRKTYKRIHGQKNKKKINVVFILQFPEMFNSFKSTFYSMLNDDNFNVDLVCVPKMQNVNTQKLSETNDALMFCNKMGIKAIDGYEGGKAFDLSSLSSDYLVLMRPYDLHMPKEYSMKNLLRIALIVYIPYSGRMTKGVHLNIEFNPLLRNFNLLFADCDEVVEWVREHEKNKRFFQYQKIYNIGHPRYDLVKNKNYREGCRTILWLPRWSTTEFNNRSYFYNYIECLLEYFSFHTDLKLIIRPHPLMFTNFITTGFKTEDEINALKNRIEQMPNVSFDANEDYLKSFDESDALISDGTSLLLEYFFTLKPVAICDQLQDLTRLGARIFETFTYVDSENGMISYLNKIVNGIDENKDKRMLLYNDVYKDHRLIGESIKNTIKQDFFMD